MIPNLLLLTACATDDPSEPDATAPAPVDELMLVDVAASPMKWTAAPDWMLMRPSVVPDVTGDGVADAIVSVYQVGENPTALLVEGPLRRPLTLPGDDLASFPSTAHLGTNDGVEQGDATGDGVADLVLGGEDAYLLSAPFAGAMDPPTAGAPVPGALRDIDGDGVLDVWNGNVTQGQVQITWGPASRWGGPPDLVLQVDCAAFVTIEELKAFPDLDGDGRRDMWVDDDEFDCATWMFPLPTTSPYDPRSDRATVQGVLGPTAIGDQTGDGVGDLWTHDRTVHAVPVTLADPIGSSNPVHAPDLVDVYPLPFDLDADGLTEFLGVDADVDTSEVRTSTGYPIDEVTGEQMVLLSGGASLANPTYATLWDIDGLTFSSDDVFLEDGTVSVLVASESIGSEVFVVDIGPGVVP